MTRECVICGTVFEPRNSNRPAATCSRACRNRLQWQRVPVRKKRTVKARKVYEFRCARCCAISYGSKPKKYCSLSCSATAKSRGGLSFSVKEGRWRVRTRDGGYMNFARCVMEAHIRRPLAADEEVHHINEDKTDDRIENLRLVTGAEHRAIHADMSRELGRRNRRLLDDAVAYIKTSGERTSDLARRFGVTDGAITYHRGSTRAILKSQGRA